MFSAWYDWSHFWSWCDCVCSHPPRSTFISSMFQRSGYLECFFLLRILYFLLRSSFSSHLNLVPWLLQAIVNECVCFLPICIFIALFVYLYLCLSFCIFVYLSFLLRSCFTSHLTLVPWLLEGSKSESSLTSWCQNIEHAFTEVKCQNAKCTIFSQPNFSWDIIISLIIVLLRFLLCHRVIFDHAIFEPCNSCLY